MGLSSEQVDKSVQVLSEWLKTNAGNVASQFGITVQQFQGVITEYQHAFTSGVTGILWVGAVVVAIGAATAWFTFGKRAE
jgi:hypothetical protein